MSGSSYAPVNVTPRGVGENSNHGSSDEESFTTHLDSDIKSGGKVGELWGLQGILTAKNDQLVGILTLFFMKSKSPGPTHPPYVLFTRYITMLH